MSQHTPTTEQVRMDYIQASEGDRVDPEEAGPQFDRWLAARDARIETAAEQRGAERALRDLAAHLIQEEFPAGHHAGIHTALLEISARLLDRGDQEGDE